jgi:multidrug efflux pump subunit AcrA (membrane-fusion protein)
MFIPVSLSVIGQAEIIPNNPSIINAPIDGVIDDILVDNNDKVLQQTPLVNFEKTQLQNSFDLAQQELKVIQTELLQAQQSSFNSKEDKALVSLLQSKIILTQETVNYQKLLLDKATILSPNDGTIVIKDKQLLIGRPFQIGENIMVIADPSDVQVEIQVPVKDSITIKKGAKINVFLDSDPLNVIKASVIKFSYEPELTAENMLAYTVTAKIEQEDIQPRIGLRGSAKIFGDEVRLFFYLFRKPIIVLRQTLGF